MKSNLMTDQTKTKCETCGLWECLDRENDNNARGYCWLGVEASWQVIPMTSAVDGCDEWEMIL